MTNAADVPQAFSLVRWICGMCSSINVLGNLFYFQLMINFFKQLFCSHTYVKMKDICMIDFGIGKLIQVKCTKCNKLKQKVI